MALSTASINPFRSPRGTNIDERTKTREAGEAALLMERVNAFIKQFSGTQSYAEYIENIRSLTERNLAAQLALADTIREIDALRALPEGWNGYNVAAPKSEAIERAKSWLRDMRTDVAVMGLEWHEPHVTADENGDVMLEWWNGEKEVTIYISEKEANYIRDWGPDVVNEMEDGDASTSESRRSLWLWLWPTR